MSITMSFKKIINNSGPPIAEVPNHKHLGLNISKDGTHHTHIDLITEKTYRRLTI
jgi:hypothetical protein